MDPTSSSGLLTIARGPWSLSYTHAYWASSMCQRLDRASEETESSAGHESYPGMKCVITASGELPSVYLWEFQNGRIKGKSHPSQHPAMPHKFPILSATQTVLYKSHQTLEVSMTLTLPRLPKASPTQDGTQSHMALGSKPVRGKERGGTS